MKNGDKIPVDLVNLFYWCVKNHKPQAEYYEDEEGNVELYIPETKEYTDFRIKIPKNSEMLKFIIDKRTK